MAVTVDVVSVVFVGVIVCGAGDYYDNEERTKTATTVQSGVRKIITLAPLCKAESIMSPLMHRKS